MLIFSSTVACHTNVLLLSSFQCIHLISVPEIRVLDHTWST